MYFIYFNIIEMMRNIILYFTYLEPLWVNSANCIKKVLI